ncbi:MAG TPA: class I SAM-dependent methyltransferase [Humisphaera sp.]
MQPTAYSDIGAYDVYNRRMTAAMMDKLFFVDKVPADLFVDFGCADGALIAHLLQWCPLARFVGYDVDPQMLAAAKVHLGAAAGDRVVLTDKWDRVREEVEAARSAGRTTALVLSSIIHEVYHYSEVREIDAFWARALNGGFDFVVVRDMVPSRGVDRLADVTDVARVYAKYLHTKELRDFETRWGSIESNKNLVHWLLKYQYTSPNWDREVKENYIPVYREDLLAMVPRTYDVAYHEHFVLPWLRRCVRRDFGIELKDQTHLKLVLERVGEKS